MADPLLQVRGLTVEFPVDGGVVRAVRGVDLDVEAGRVVAVVGESGSGKTTTALAVMGLLSRGTRVEGSVRFRGQELLGLPVRQLNEVRGRDLTMVFQDPSTSLNPVRRIGPQVAEVVRAHRRVGRHEADTRAEQLLATVGLPDPAGAARRYPHELSGGMRQRVVIAMAIANDPAVVIADEPTSALDVTIQAQVIETLQVAARQTGAAIVLVTHDLGVVAGMADEVVVMYAGRVVEHGPVDDVFARPRMPYTLGLLGSVPDPDARPGTRLAPVAGSPPSPVALPSGCPFRPRCPLARDLCAEVEPALLPTTAAGHRAACHFWRELPDGVRPEDVFAR